MEDEKIIVTGGTGFIGAKLVERLVSLGATPHLLIRKDSNVDRLQHLKEHIIFDVINLLDSDSLTSVVEEINPDMVFHLAAYGVYSYTNDELENIHDILETNITGTANLLYALRNTNVRVIVNTGSCFEYGSTTDPFTEEFQLNPCNIYGVSKVASTFLAQNYYKIYNMPVVTLRPFTIYGPGQDKKRFISTVIQHCLNGSNIALPAVEIVRDYIYIDDVVDAYITVAEKSNYQFGDIFNVSTGEAHTLEDVAEMLIHLSGSTNSKINKGEFPLRKGEVLSLVGDNNSIRLSFGWEPQHSLREGLKKTLDFVKYAEESK